MSAPPRSPNALPIPMECDAPFLTVKGELPRGLNGTLYRNGANPQFEAKDAHWFFGDGMIHAFHLENGRARYRNRWVRTPKWLAEHDAGRALFGAYNRKLPDAPAGATDDGNVANTSIVLHGGRLLALEEAHLPVEIDPHTLETRGTHDFGGALNGPFTAHPKIDPETGEMIFFGYNARGPLTPAMSFGTIDAAGKVTRFEIFDVPYPAIVHDFIVTKNHVLFPVLPLAGSLWRAVRGGPPYAWDPSKGAHVGVMKRNASARDITWFRGAACFVFHVMNAWDDGNGITALVMQSEEPPLFPGPDGRLGHDDRCRARLTRWRFDLSANTDTFRQEPLDDIAGELPRIDERRAGREGSHGWYASANPELPLIGGLSGIVHVDGGGRRRGHYVLPAGDTISEPAFVPRAHDTPEGDGWLLAVVWRARENRSDLAVFEACEVEAGPVALVQLGHRVPDGFHGSFVPLS